MTFAILLIIFILNLMSSKVNELLHEVEHIQFILGQVEENLEDINDRWILCGDALPDHRNNVIICLKNGYVNTGYLSGGVFYDMNSFPYEDVIAWQPLPERKINLHKERD